MKEPISRRPKKLPLTKDQIVEVQKKMTLIGIILIAISLAFTLAVTIYIWIIKEKMFGYIVSALLIIETAILIYTIFIYKNKSDDYWVKEYVRVKHLDTQQRGIDLLKEINIIHDKNFTLSKVINIQTSGLVTNKWLIDDTNRKFIFKKGEKYSKAYRFEDIIDYEVYENGASRVQGRAGSALIGGAFFGIGGAIVGSSRARNISNECNQLKLIIRVHDLKNPQIVFTYINGLKYDKASVTYKSMIDNIQYICSTLEYMTHEKTPVKPSTSTTTQVPQVIATKSKKESLIELKEMLDLGLITESDYEQKKKQILEL